MSSALEVWSHNHSATREVPIKYCLIKVCTLFFKKNKVCILLSLFLLLAFRVYWGFPGGSDGIELARDVGDWDSIPGLGRSPGGGHGNPLQYPRLEDPMDRGAWWATVHGVAKSQTPLKGDGTEGGPGPGLSILIRASRPSRLGRGPSRGSAAACSSAFLPGPAHRPGS